MKTPSKVKVGGSLPTFRPTAMSLPGCCYVNAVASADLDGDGLADIVSGNGLGYDFSVFLATGPGRFADPVNYPVGTPDLSRVVLATGDVTGDGHADIVATGTTEDGLWLFPGDGTGAFGAARALSLGGGRFPYAVAIADLDGNGHLDVVTTNSQTSDVSVLLGSGGGNFAATATFAIPEGPNGLALADATGDGYRDIVTTGRIDRVAVVLAGDGSGGFTAAATHAVGARADPWDVAVADVDGDGNADLLTSNAGGDGSEFPPLELEGSVSVLRGDGAGGFAAAGQIPLTGIQGRAHALVVADLTADGHPDIALGQTIASVATILVGDGTGGFDSRLVRPTGHQPGPVAVADVTGDGHLDLVTGNSESLSILPGDGAGDVGFAGRAAAGTTPYAVVPVDLDDDGRLDLVTADFGGNSVSVLRNLGGGAMAAPQQHAVGANPTSLASGDIDGDGHADIVAADFGGGTVSVLLGDGAGGLGEAVPFDVGGDFESPYALALGDTNGDGHPDVATVNTNIENESISVLLGDGTGGFGAATLHRVGPDAYNAPQGIVMADVSGDGHADIATANLDTGVSLLLGDGSGDFADATLLATGDGPVVVVAGDVDGDGTTDLVTLNHTGQSVSVLSGQGGGAFAAPQAYPIYRDASFYSMPWAWGLALGDVSNDGLPDIATANTQNDTVSVLVNDGSGAFPRYDAYGAGARPGAAAIVDVDGDGRADIVTTNRENHDVSILFAGGAGAGADLALDVAATPGNIAPGAVMAFQAALVNHGPAAAAFPGIGFAFDAVLPDLQVGAPAGWSCDAPRVGGGVTSIACTADALDSGATAGFTAAANAPAAVDGDVVTMIAAATSTTPDPVAANDSDAVAVSVDAETDLAVAISGPAVHVRGSVAHYAVTLGNDGPTTAPQAALTLRINAPAQAVALSAPAGWNCTPLATPTYAAHCTRAGATPVGDATFDAAVTIGSRLFPARLTLRASAASAASDPDMTDNSATFSSRLGRMP